MFGDSFETSPLLVGHQLSSNHVLCSWMHTRVAGDVWLLVVICSNKPSSSSTKRAGAHSTTQKRAFRCWALTADKKSALPLWQRYQRQLNKDIPRHRNGLNTLSCIIFG